MFALFLCLFYTKKVSILVFIILCFLGHSLFLFSFLNICFPFFSSLIVLFECANNYAHTLVVLVLCVFGTCRAFRLAEVFLARCLFVKFSCTPVFVCLKGP